MSPRSPLNRRLGAALAIACLVPATWTVTAGLAAASTGEEPGLEISIPSAQPTSSPNPTDEPTPEPTGTPTQSPVPEPSDDPDDAPGSNPSDDADGTPDSEDRDAGAGNAGNSGGGAVDGGSPGLTSGGGTGAAGGGGAGTTGGDADGGGASNAGEADEADAASADEVCEPAEPAMPTEPAPGGEPAIVDRDVYLVGEQVTATAEDYDPGEKVQLVLFSEPTLVGEFTADQDGQVQAVFPVSEDLAPGTHIAQFTGWCQSVAQAEVVIGAELASAETGALPGWVPWVGGAAGLLVLAAGSWWLFLKLREDDEEITA